MTVAANRGIAFKIAGMGKGRPHRGDEIWLGLSHEHLHGFDATSGDRVLAWSSWPVRRRAPGATGLPTRTTEKQAKAVAGTGRGN